jgi:hypothetical protein
LSPRLRSKRPDLCRYFGGIKCGNRILVVPLPK